MDWRRIPGGGGQVTAGTGRSAHARQRHPDWRVELHRGPRQTGQGRAGAGLRDGPRSMQRLLSPVDVKTNPHFTVDTERSLRNEGGGSLVWDPADGFPNGEKHSLASAGRCHYRHTSEILRFGGRLRTTAIQRVTRFFWCPSAYQS